VHIASVLTTARIDGAHIDLDHIDGMGRGPETRDRELAIAVRSDQAPGREPVRLALPASAIGRRVLRRRDRLARGLASIGVGREDRVIVLCCERHREDLHVAQVALEALGAVPVVPASWNDRCAVQRLAGANGVTTYLACEEGVQVWRAAGVRGRMVGDSTGAGVLWWKALEARHASAGPARAEGASDEAGSSILLSVSSAAG
jgi:non-ribosomal peptide synthetase component F